MKRRILFGLVILYFSLAAVLQAATYYVNASSGSDSYDGLYETFQSGSNGPWKTLAKANNSVSNGTHTINVAAGTYNEDIFETHSGTDANSPLYWKANGQVYSKTFAISGSYVKLEGFTLAATDSGNYNGTIWISGSYVDVESCRVINSSRSGVRLVSASANCTVNSCTFYNCKDTGILVVGSNHLITNNDISRTQAGSLSDANGMNIEVPTGETVSTGHVIRSNYIHDIYFTDPTNADVHIDAIQSNYLTAYYSTNVTIDANHIYLWQEATSAVATSSGFMIAGANDWTIKNNIVECWNGYNTAGSGTPQNVKIYNNIFRSSLSWTHNYYGAGVHFTGGSGLEIKNNIFLDFDLTSRGARHIYVDGGASVTVKNNLFWNSNSSTPAFVGVTPDGTNQVGVNPLFVANFSDMHLAAGSPCIDAGATVASVLTDRDGVARPQGIAYDLGPYERSSITSPLPPSRLRLVPLN